MTANVVKLGQIATIDISNVDKRAKLERQKFACVTSLMSTITGRLQVTFPKDL